MTELTRRFTELFHHHTGGRPRLRRSLRNIAWLSLDQGIRMTMGLIVGVWVARYLGPTRFGEYSYAAAAMAFVVVVAGMGLEDFGVRELVSDPAHSGEILGACFGLRAIGAAVAIAACQIVIRLIPPQDEVTRALVVIFSLTALVQSFYSLKLWFQSQVQAKFIVIASNSALVVASALRIYLIARGADVKAFAWAWVLEQSLAAVGLVVCYKVCGHEITKWRLSASRARSLLKYSWPLLLSGLAFTIYTRIDQLLLQEFLGVREVGIYAAATKISELWIFVPLAAANSVFPALVEDREKDAARYYRNLQSYFTASTWIAIAVAITMSLGAGPIISVLYGPGYADAAPVLRIHAWMLVFLFQAGARGQWMIAERLTGYALLCTTSVALISIAANCVLIPWAGMRGAAVASILSQASAAILLPLLFPATRKAGVMLLKSFVFAK